MMCRKSNTKFCCSKGKGKESEITYVESHLKEMLTCAMRIHFKAGHIVYYAGHDASGLYILASGHPAFVQSNGSEKKGVGISNLIGLNHLLSDTPYCTTCIARDDLEFLFVPKVEIFTLLNTMKEPALPYK